MILASAEGISNAETARRVGASPQAVGKWRKRFLEAGPDGLYDRPRPGRPRTYDNERVATLVNRALKSRPKAATHWSTRTLAKAEGLSQSTVSRWLRLFGIKPHLTTTFKLSTGPFSVEKVFEIVGLYLNPPDHAVVLCVGEKTQVQVLDRTQPALPLGPGYVQGYLHDYIGNGTTTLFAALDVATGDVLAKCSKRHQHQEFLAFLRLIDKEVPTGFEIHLIVDNCATHSHTKAKAWLAARPRYHLHHTPTYSSWLNQVERWFALISEKAIKRGSCKSERSLIHRIHKFKRHYNKTAAPFVWAATSESIPRKIERPCTRLSDSPH